MLLSCLGFAKHTCIVRWHVLTHEPPETREAYNELRSLCWPTWRIWMVLASAYRFEAKVAAVEHRPVDLNRYKQLLRRAGNYPDGYTQEDAREVIDGMPKKRPNRETG